MILLNEVHAQDQQEIDSIKKLIPSVKNSKVLVENNNKIAYLFGAISIDSSLFYSNKARQLAKKIKFRKGLAVSYSYTARAYMDKGNFTNAFENFTNALDLFKEEKDSVNVLDCYTGLSFVASYGASQLKSLNYSLEALKYAEALKDTSSLITIYNNIGVIYKKLDNYTSSLFYLNKSLEIQLSKANTLNQDLAVSYSNVGVLKVDNNKVKEAEEDYKQIRRLLSTINSEYHKSYLLLSLAGYYIAIKDFNVSKKYIDSATIICEKNDFKQFKSRAYRKKAEWYYYQNLFKESIEGFNACLSYSKSIDVYEEFPEIYKKRAEAYAKLGLYEQAFYSLQTANKSIDSLKNNSVASFLTDFEDQTRINELEKHKFEQALKDQQLENASSKKKVLISRAVITIIMLLVIIGIVMYYLLKVRKKNIILNQQHETINQQKLLLENNILKLELKEEKLQNSIATRDKLFSIIGHDLKSPFNAILGFSNLLTENYNSYTDDKRKIMIEQIEKASESAFKLLENLLYWARSQGGFIKIKPKNHSLKELVDASILPYLGAAAIKEISVLNTISKDISVCVDDETIKIVCSNLFNNAIKFSNVGGEISITAQVNTTVVELCFQDNGIGMDETIINGLFTLDRNVKREGTLNERGTGLGLILCEEFVKKNKGKIQVESKVGEGSKFYVLLPIKC